MMLVFVHVLLHPLVHVVGTARIAGDLTTVRADAHTSGSSLISSDQCELCRVGHNATAAPELPKTDLLNPRWIRTALQAVNYASLQADLRLPSRAPPVL
jgi:hypothetical protein